MGMGCIMMKRYKECSKEYMLYLLNTNSGDGAGVYTECDSIVRIETYNYTFRVYNWGVITADRELNYKPYEPHASYKCHHTSFNTLFNAIMARVGWGRAIDLSELLK